MPLRFWCPVPARLAAAVLVCAFPAFSPAQTARTGPTPSSAANSATSAKVNGVQVPAGKWAIVLHGGAGVIERSSMTPERDGQYRAGLHAAIGAAAKVLDANGSAVDAVEAGLRVLEDNPLFNAGKGAVFTADGRNELDAAIMEGATLKAGAIAGVTRTKNPISLAKAVMQKSPHVMLVGPGADQFSVQAGLEQVDPAYFFTEPRWQGLVRQLKKEG